MSQSAVKFRDVRSTVRKEIATKSHRSLSLDTRANRGSYVPERTRPSSDERKSGNKAFFKWGSGRKSSINLVDTKRKDARPLSDKAYQKKKISDLVEFLKENGFNQQISTSKLTSPTRKDLENIFQFLYNYFDPTFEIKKIEEDIPKILKNLGYPFTVNKSAFVYVSRTNFPSLLGALIWLMDLCKFVSKVDIKSVFEPDAEDERSQKHTILRHYICQCYHQDIDDEEKENCVFNEIIKSSMPENLDELIASNEEKKLQLESINREIAEVKELAQTREMLETNLQKIKEYISKMTIHCQKKSEVCEQLNEDLKLKESSLKALQVEVSKKQDLYDAQGFDGKKHLKYFEFQKKELNETLNEKRKSIVKVQDELWESEIEYKKKTDKMIADAETFRKLYNSIVEETKALLQPLLNIQIPQIQRLCSNFYFDFPNWEISLNKYDSESRNSHRNALEDIVEKIKSTDEILKRIQASLNQKLNEIEMKKSELSIQLKLSSIQENQKENDLSSKKKQIEEEISSLEIQCEKIQQNILTLQTEKSSLRKMYNEMLEELNELQEFREKKESELKAYLVKQEEFFKNLAKDEEMLAKLSEEYGNEIAEKIEEALRNNKQ